jgi:hypothetical protein
MTMSDSRFLDSHYKKESLEKLHSVTRSKKCIVKGETLRNLPVINDETEISEVFVDVSGEALFGDKYNVNFPQLLHHSTTYKAIVFAKELAHKIRGVDFAVCSIKRTKSVFWVFMEEQVYTMGQIGYGDFYTTTTPAQYEYMVSSYPIQNDKYDSYSEQHYMARSMHIDKAIKNASSYLRNPAPKDVAILNAFKAKREFTDIGDNIEYKVRSSAKEVLNDEVMLIRELRNLLDTDHKFIHDVFRSNVERWIHDTDELADRKRKALNLYHVRVYMEEDVQTFDVIPMDNVQGDVHKSVGDLVTYTVDNVPEYIVGKVSVLSMVNAETFVDDVGYRDEAGCFYITR